MADDKAKGLIDFLMVYGWAILAVLAMIGAILFFGVIDQDTFTNKESVYDCGPFLIKGIEKKEGELRDASFYIKEQSTNYEGLYAKAYYDMIGCLDITNTTNETTRLP